LEDLFRSGRFQPAPTLMMVEIGGCAGAPIEAVLCNRDGSISGECWRADLEALLDLARAEKDTVLSNPNLRVVTDIIEEIDLCRKSVDALAIEIEKKKAATVVPFRPR
jgi:hypothetical protein